ncbi:MAG: VOC family protein [bacterium]|nr:VOC family protein [bacterium]
MGVYLEHANMTVPDVDAAIRFFQTIDPALIVRHDETPEGSYRWAHVGTDTTYIALQAPHLGTTPEEPREAYVNHGVNHLAWVVDDVDAVAARLKAAGYRRGMVPAPHPNRKRAYYYDSAGFEWELLEYLSDDPAQRNAYT